MPIYEYCCDNCHKVFEEWVRHMDDRATRACPECNGTARRIVSNTSFVLKGGGWYVTDYGYRKGKDESGGAAETRPSASGAEPGNAGEASGAPAKTSAPAADSSGKAPPEAKAGKPPSGTAAAARDSSHSSSSAA
jgi:putative FmdB family regulatory protein